MTYRHALVAVDLRSAQSVRLLERAAALVRDGRLSVLAVIEVGTFDDDREAVGSMIEEEFSACTAHLARICEQAGIDHAHQRVLVGKAPAHIASFARDEACDLVVLGQHEDRWDRPGIGSTTDATLRQLHCDALVVRHPARDG